MRAGNNGHDDGIIVYGVHFTTDQYEMLERVALEYAEPGTSKFEGIIRHMVERIKGQGGYDTAVVDCLHLLLY